MLTDLADRFGRAWAYRILTALGTAIVVAMIAVSVFTWLGKVGAETRLKGMTADRDSLITWGDKICGVVGEPFQVPDRKDWGRNCFARIVTLRAFRTKATDQTNAALVEHLNTQLAKKEADLARAQRDKRLAFEALDALAQEAAHVPETNQVGPAYYRALNRTAGLRDADAAQAR